MTAGKALFLLDYVLMLAAWPILLRLSCWGSECFEATPDGLAALLYPCANVACLYALGLYRREAMLDIRGSLARVPLAVSFGAVTTGITMVLLSRYIGHPADRVRMFAGAMIGFTFAGILTRLVFALLREGGMFRRRLLVIGTGPRAWEMLDIIGAAPAANSQYDITFIQEPHAPDPDPRLQAAYGARIRAMDLEDLLPLARQLEADEIVVAPDDRRGREVQGLLDCKKHGFPVVPYLSFIEHESRRVDVNRPELIGWLIYTQGFYFGTLDRFLKRALDIAVSLMLLILFTPFLVAAAIAIKLDDGGPLLYRQTRVTLHGREFPVLKLRSMRTDAEKAGAVWASVRDPRITRVGQILRQSRVDEMPQLFNVLRGEMSLVGPRPERPEFITELSEQLPLYNERHMVKAGLTGWAQINYPYGASIEDARAKLSYDLYYVKNFSILFDMLIILQTLRVVLWPSGAR